MRAKGKRLTNFEVGQVIFIEPLVKESSSDIIAASGEEGENPDNIDSDSIDGSNDSDGDGEENFTEDLPTLF